MRHIVVLFIKLKGSTPSPCECSEPIGEKHHHKPRIQRTHLPVRSKNPQISVLRRFKSRLDFNQFTTMLKLAIFSPFKRCLSLIGLTLYNSPRSHFKAHSEAFRF